MSIVESELEDAPHLRGLNEEQLSAATTTEGPVLLLAGAGTGKTKTLVSRIVHLVRSGIEPDRIMAVTFTKKATAEMKDRLTHELGAIANEITVGTYSSLGLQLLRERPELAGLKPRFNVVSEREALPYLRAAIGDDEESRAWATPDVCRDILKLFQRFKEALQDPFDSNPVWAGPEPSELEEKARSLFGAYQAALQAANAADFGDMLLWPTLSMRRDDALRRHWARAHDYILADEHQDANPVNRDWLYMLARDHRNIFVVGDDSQSIYQWRGAEARIILDFQRDWPGAKVFALEKNYRSTVAIAAAANALITNNRDRVEKKLVAANDIQGEPVRFREFGSLPDEARWVIADAVRRLSSPDPATAFILYRASWLSRAFEEASIRAGLKYCLVGDVGFYERESVRDALAYAALMHDPTDKEAFMRVVDRPARGLGLVSIGAIMTEADAGDRDYLAAAMRLAERPAVSAGARRPGDRPALPNAPARDGARTLAALRAGWLDRIGDGLDVALNWLLDASGYEAMWRESDDVGAEAALENLAELGRVAADVGTVDGLLDRARSAAEFAQDDAALKLMTMHRSKGLEADHVWLVGWAEGVLPGRQDIEAECKGNPAPLEAARNLAYVGVTRGRRTVTISATPGRGGVSRFVWEMPVVEI